MQQRGMVSTGRSRAHQLGVLPQHGPKPGRVARDDRFHRGLEPGDGVVMGDGAGEGHEILPGLEGVLVRDHHLRIGKIEGRGSHLGHRPSLEAWVLPLEAPLRALVTRLQVVEQRLRLVLVLLQRRAERKR